MMTKIIEGTFGEPDFRGGAPNIMVELTLILKIRTTKDMMVIMGILKEERNQKMMMIRKEKIPKEEMLMTNRLYHLLKVIIPNTRDLDKKKIR